MSTPGNVAQVPAEDRKKTEDFDAEEGETEDVGCIGEAGGQDCRGHEGGVGGEGCGKSVIVIKYHFSKRIGLRVNIREPRTYLTPTPPP